MCLFCTNTLPPRWVPADGSMETRDVRVVCLCLSAARGINTKSCHFMRCRLLSFGASTVRRKVCVCVKICTNYGACSRLRDFVINSHTNVGRLSPRTSYRRSSSDPTSVVVCCRRCVCSMTRCQPSIQPSSRSDAIHDFHVVCYQTTRWGKRN